MKGYHFFMRIGLMLNVLARYSECFVELTCSLGIRGTIKFIFETLKGPWLNIDDIKKQVGDRPQLRLA